MQDESPLGRALWAIVLSVVVAIVLFSFARRPLLSGDGEASGFSRPLTLWVAGAEGGGGQAEAVARQLADCWQASGRSATVGVLPGGSSSSVVDFLERVRNTPDELLLISGTTLSDIARERDDLLLPEPRERAQHAVRLLGRAAPIAVLEGERLALAVRADSPVRTAAQLLSLLSRQPARPIVGVADDAWLEGNLAALVQSVGLHQDMPYDVFTSSHSAVLGLDEGQAQAVLAPSSALHRDLRDGRLRELPWPPAGGQAPRGWVAIVAPAGLSPRTVAALREQTHGLCTGAAWSRLLREDGLAPVAPAKIGLEGFLADGVREATRLQTLAARTIRDY